MVTTLLVLSLALGVFAAAFALLAGFALLDRRSASRLRGFAADERDRVVFLFEDQHLLDATAPARAILAKTSQDGTDWARLSGLLTSSFPDLTAKIADLADIGDLILPSQDGTSQLRAEWHDGVARLTLEGTEANRPTHEVDHFSLASMTHELESLRATADLMPFPVWRVGADGTIAWCNRAYLELADIVHGVEDLRVWPPNSPFGPLPATDQAEPRRRVPVTALGEGARHWFEVSEMPFGDGERLFCASPVDRLVEAETSRDAFVSTLSKTFAALPTGLAIFDRARELRLFNPALLDLTMLPVEFLSGQPSLSAFLDKLRELRMIPEPKDYRSWRLHLSELVEAAENGTYEETWTLPAGQTYRVTGRPHPDGAVALLFEDVSTETRTARRFRAELETGQATLDALPQAIAVFTPGGVLSLTNRAYARLWGVDPSESLADLSVVDTIDHWRAVALPSPVWPTLRDFVTRLDAREPWSTKIVLKDGRGVTCRATPLEGGGTLVDFAPIAARETATNPETPRAAQLPAQAKA
jgi:PAS domain-containing protein